MCLVLAISQMILARLLSQTLYVSFSQQLSTWGFSQLGGWVQVLASQDSKAGACDIVKTQPWKSQRVTSSYYIGEGSQRSIQVQGRGQRCFHHRRNALGNKEHVVGYAQVAVFGKHNPTDATLWPHVRYSFPSQETFILVLPQHCQASRGAFACYINHHLSSETHSKYTCYQSKNSEHLC